MKLKELKHLEITKSLIQRQGDTSLDIILINYF